ncbi:hypothetical protein [Archangium sp.]|uniref:hypothetical protein n=1 Tax=Archangium sp. TaxID=1872627 RepID=UPI002D2DB013|nr:hypothetical protein [Archangium sp.]HYO58594.1 hypothetical protein [Archangium sp.]
MKKATSRRRVGRFWLCSLLALLLVAVTARAQDDGGIALALEVAEVPAPLVVREVPSIQDWAREFAEQEEWDTSPEYLESYWQMDRKLRDTRLGTVMLGRFASESAHHRGWQTWVLLFRSRTGTLKGVSPLLIQSPYTNTQEHNVSAADMKLLGKRGQSSRLLWVELEDEMIHISRQDSEIAARTTTRLGYVFRVDKAGGLSCVACGIPISSVRYERYKGEATGALRVTFPKANVMKIEAGSANLPPGMARWVGKYELSSGPAKPSEGTSHGG